MSTTTIITASQTPGKKAAIAPSLVTASPAAQDAIHAISGPAPLAIIRRYNPETDRSGIEAVFREIYTPHYHFSGLTNIAFIVFCRAYLDFSPETCFVLSVPEAHDPRVLGYIVGTSSSKDFCAAFAADQEGCRTDIEGMPAAPTAQDMRDAELRGRCMEYFRQRNAWVSAVSSGLSGIENIVVPPHVKALLEEKYPAHFHMAVLPEARRYGYGSRLSGAFCERLRGLGVAGVFAAMPVGNEGAERLYARYGFERLKDDERSEEVGVVGGGEGEMEGKVFMVRDLDER